MLNEFQKCLNTMFEGLPTKRQNERMNDGLKQCRENFKLIHDNDKSKGGG